MSHLKPVRMVRAGGLSPLILLLGGIALVFLLLALNRTDPAIKAARHEDPYSAKMKLALTYMESGPPMAGIRLLVKLQKQYPKRFEAPFQLGIMAMNTGQYAKAAGWFGKATQAASGKDKVYALINWSDALVMVDKKDSASIILKEVFNYSNDSLLLRSVNEKLKALK